MCLFVLFFFPQGTAKAFSGDEIARPLSRKVCTCVGPGTTVIMHNDIFFKKMGDFAFRSIMTTPTENFSPVQLGILLELPAFTLTF